MPKKKIKKKKTAVRKQKPNKKAKSPRRTAKRKKKAVAHHGRYKKVFTPEKLQELLEKGRRRGFVTYSEILYLFPEIENDVNGLDKLFDDLEKESIEVKETTELITIEERPGKKGFRDSEVKIDPVQMYLKEIGSISFVTANEEKEL